MRIGASLFLIALGAVLTFAVNVNSSHGFNINNAGVILMLIGAAGLVITGIWMSTRRRTDVVTQAGAGYGPAVEPVYGAPVGQVVNPAVGPVYGAPAGQVVNAPVGSAYGPAVRRRTVYEPNDPALGPY
jgi:cytochrome c biogenesis protein CcdA